MSKFTRPFAEVIDPLGVADYYRRETQSERCDRCCGAGLVTLFNYDGYGSDADDQPCPECRPCAGYK